jgi:hypothetical protein
VHKLTRVLPRGSTTALVDGIELGFADSGELLQKGTAKFIQLRPSLLDSFNIYGPGSMAELQDYSMVTGVTSIADERARLELGFRVPARKLEREESAVSRVFLGGGNPLYS